MRWIRRYVHEWWALFDLSLRPDYNCFGQDVGQERVVNMKIVPISEAKRQIKELVDQAGQSDEVYYITRYSQAKAVMLGVEHYETLLRRVEQLEDGLVRVWAAIEGAEGERSVMLPTPDGRWRPFRPSRPVSPDVRAAIERAAQLAWRRRDWTPERTVQEGRQVIERARQEAIAQGIAIDDEREVALDD